MNFRRVQPRKSLIAAFTFTELLSVVGVLALLSALCLPMLARDRNIGHTAIDLSNTRQILYAMTMYCADNRDFMPHPTWGSDLTGPDGWAYATVNSGRIPGGPSVAPSCYGKDEKSIQYADQLRFFQIGQIAPFIRLNNAIMHCPTDVERRTMLGEQNLWLLRSAKITSYTWTSAAISEFFAGATRTYKLSDFNGTDVLMWEADERNPFAFNDAACNPENGLELVSRRHGVAYPSNRLGDGGVALIGRFGGGAEFIKTRTFLGWHTNRSARRPNELFCGPTYRYR